MKKDDLLSWGITLLIFGGLFLLKTTTVPSGIGHYLFDTRNFPLIAGIVFLIFHHNRIYGAILLVIGIFSRFDAVMLLTKELSPYILPGALIASGIIMLFALKKGK